MESQSLSFPEPENFMVDPIAFSVAKGVKIMSSTIDVSSIVALTRSGHTAKIISAIRPVNGYRYVKYNRNCNKKQYYSAYCP